MHTVTHLARTQTYIWQTASRRVGQLAGIKLDPSVPRCSMGLKAILKASPTVLHQWESMDSGQGKQPGASHTPGGLHLLSLCTVAPLCSGWHIISWAHMPVEPDYTRFNMRLGCFTSVINLNKHSEIMWMYVGNMCVYAFIGQPFLLLFFCTLWSAKITVCRVFSPNLVILSLLLEFMSSII